jgi:serpin B
MMKMKKNWVVYILVANCMLSADLAFAQQKTSLSNVVSGNNAFAFELYAKLKTTEGNIFFSPYSISAALAMTYAGARGNTEKQMAQVLHFGKDQKGFHEAFGELQTRMNDIQKKGNVKLSVANSLWMQKDYKFLPEFLELTGKNYEAGFNYVDFKNETEKTRVEINTWVEKQTNEKIKELIKKRILNATIKMVLANAIYFKGSWADKIDTTMTREMLFRASLNDSVPVKMMVLLEHSFKYYENKKLQYLELPYIGNDLSMTIILPKNKYGLYEIEKSINMLTLDSINTRLSKDIVNIFIPKFRTTQDLMLIPILLKMGITDAFENVADFSGMNGKKDLLISAVIHKAFVDVNEEGTEAAAATAVIMATKGGEPEYPVFRADHPFLFLIRDNATGSILFMGRIVNPLL